MQKSLNKVDLPELITTDPISDIKIVSKTDITKAVSSIPPFQIWA